MKPLPNRSDIKRYVLGFLFSPELSLVLLIKKNRPKWQRGKFNGIGGKIEPGETAPDAMRRECREETNVDVCDWRHFATLNTNMDGPEEVFCFYASTEEMLGAEQITDEELRFESAVAPHVDWMLYNVPWLIAAARMHKLRGQLKHYEVTEVF
ncbi:MAG: NUDIX domain-containing protein [Verrucomicrobia bacterium]|nr:NUDIX domain-containing protein [Verrucomicrobiota bacterium]